MIDSFGRIHCELDQMSFPGIQRIIRNWNEFSVRLMINPQIDLLPIHSDEVSAIHFRAEVGALKRVKYRVGKCNNPDRGRDTCLRERTADAVRGRRCTRIERSTVIAPELLPDAVVEDQGDQAERDE